MPPRIKNQLATIPLDLPLQSIQEVIPDEAFLFAEDVNIFQTIYPNDQNADIADNIYGLMEVLEYYQSQIVNSTYLTKGHDHTSQAEAFNKAISLHKTRSIPQLAKKNLTPSNYLVKFSEIKGQLEFAFSSIDVDSFLRTFNNSRTTINKFVQSMAQINQKISRQDTEFTDNYYEFQKSKKTMVTQANQLKEFPQARRCNSLLKKINLLMEKFKKLCSILPRKKMNIRDNGLNEFDQLNRSIVELKCAMFGSNILQRMKEVLLLKPSDRRKIATTNAIRRQRRKEKADAKKKVPDLKKSNNESNKKSLSDKNNKAENSDSGNSSSNDESDSNSNITDEDEDDTEEEEEEDGSDEEEDEYTEEEEEEEEEEEVIEEEEEEEEEEETAETYEETGESTGTDQNGEEEEEEEKSENETGVSTENENNEEELKIVNQLFYNEVTEITSLLMQLESEGVEFPIHVLYPMQQLYDLKNPKEDDLHSAFINSVTILKNYIKSLNFPFYSILLFDLSRELEIFRIKNSDSLLDNEQLKTLYEVLSNLPDKILKIENIQNIDDLMQTLLNSENLPESVRTILVHLQRIFIPVHCLLKIIIPMNEFIKNHKLQKVCDFIFVPLTNYSCHMEIGSKLAPHYLKHINPNPDFDSYVQKLISEIQGHGVQLINDEETGLFSYSQIVAPNLTIILNNLNAEIIRLSQSAPSIKTTTHPLSETTNESKFEHQNESMPEHQDESQNEPQDDLPNHQPSNPPNEPISDSTETKDENDLPTIVQSTISSVTATTSQSSSELDLVQLISGLTTQPFDANVLYRIECRLLAMKDVVVKEETMNYLQTLRKIHLLFAALEARNVISYPSAVTLTYIRTFVSQVCENDILNSQSLILPIDPFLVSEIKKCIDTRSEILENKLRSTFLLRMKSFDYYPADSFVSLFNIENNLSFFSYPVELEELVQNAKLDIPSNDEDIGTIKYIQSVLNINSQSENDFSIIKALATIYFEFLKVCYDSDVIMVSDTILYIMNNSHSIINESYFVNVFKIIHETLNLIDLIELIDKMIKVAGPLTMANGEIISLLTKIKRGCFSTEAVAKLATSILNYDNDELKHLFEKMCKFILFLDMHDLILSSILQYKNISTLRNINIGLFCVSMARRLLFLKTSLIWEGNENVELIMLGRNILMNKLTATTKLSTDSINFHKDIIKKIKDNPNYVPVDLEKYFITKKEDRNKLLCTLAYDTMKSELKDFINLEEIQSRRFCDFEIGIFVTPFDITSEPSEDDESNENNINTNFESTNDTKLNDNFIRVKEKIQKQKGRTMIPKPMFPIPSGLLDLEEQNIMALYYQKLQDERNDLVHIEMKYQQYIEEKEKFKNFIGILNERRQELVQKLKDIRTRLDVISSIPTGEIGEVNTANSNETDYYSPTNEMLLKNMREHNVSIIQKFNNDLRSLENRMNKTMAVNRTLRSLLSEAFKCQGEIENEEMKRRQSLLNKRKFEAQNVNHEIDLKIKYSEIDKEIQSAMVELKIVPGYVFEEMRKMTEEIKELESKTAEIEINRAMQAHMTCEEKSQIDALLKEIDELKKEKAEVTEKIEIR